ncbi:MAG: iron-sulfur cluster assembly scaffold protein [Steroidobacteraceae bacterium]
MAESAPSYNDLVRDHFTSPRNTPCHLSGPDVVFGQAGNEGGGVVYRLSARMRGARLAELRFEAYGCPHTIAAGSLLTEQLAGSTVEEALRWNWRTMSRALELPAEKRGRLLILEDALRSLMAAAGVPTDGP